MRDYVTRVVKEESIYWPVYNSATYEFYQDWCHYSDDPCHIVAHELVLLFLGFGGVDLVKDFLLEFTNGADYEKAKQMLADAGYPDGFKTEIYYGTGGPIYCCCPVMGGATTGSKPLFRSSSTGEAFIGATRPISPFMNAAT